MRVVVSRYNEDVEWTKHFDDVLIYNKGEPLPGFSNVQVLENVGREGHTYYKHICDHYETLDDYTVFLQGYPFDHTREIIARVDALDPTVDFEFLCDTIINCNLTGCRYSPDLSMIPTYQQLFDEEKTSLHFEFGKGAQFVVSKRRILQRPKEFYQRIVDMLGKDVNPIEGHIIERFHGLVFSSNYTSSEKDTSLEERP